MNPTLRPSTPEDLDWLEVFYERLMRPIVELSHHWHPTAFRKSFDPSITFIIQFDGEDIGMLRLQETEECIHLRDIQVRKEFQGRGVGSAILNDIISRADASGLPVRLRVLTGNRARHWYKRLGFRAVYEEAHASLMERPATNSNASP